MKVMLVDDEPMAIEYMLRLIPWQEHGYEIVATASNGESALRQMERHRPQIIVLDIRMPVMDGLELIHAVSSTPHRVKFLILSAYKDFEYARQAIELGASGYLIKHAITPDKLLTELGKAKNAWESEESSRRLAVRKHIKAWLTGGGAADEEHYGSLGRAAIVLLQLDIPINLPPSTFPSLPDLDWWTFTERLSEDSGWRLMGDFGLGETQHVFLLSTNRTSESQIRNSLRETFRRLQIQFSCEYDLTLSTFFITKNDDIHTLPQAFSKIKRAAQHAIFCGKQALVGVDQLPIADCGPPSALVTEDMLHQFAESLDHRDLAGVEKAVYRFFEAVRNPVWDLPQLHQTIELLEKQMSAYLKKNRLVKQTSTSSSGEISTIVPLYEIDEIRDWMLGRFLKALQDNSMSRGISGKLTKVLQYIHQHCCEDIGIEDAAAATGISASYLYLLFKQELGRTFLDYMTECRISRAKHLLLREPASKISDIAERVGYRSTSYFSQVFKKMTGLHPHQYRERGDIT